MNDTLNYWLGKLLRLQLFGHGVKPMYVQTPDREVREIREVRYEHDRVVIEVE